MALDESSAILKLTLFARWVSAQVGCNSIRQVHTIADYAKRSPSSDQRIMLALEGLIPC